MSQAALRRRISSTTFAAERKRTRCPPPITTTALSFGAKATALAAYYFDMKDNEGWLAARLCPLLAGLLELVPWLKQWHNDYNAEHATRMGDYFESFVIDEARGQGFTLDDLLTWKPAAERRGGRRTAER